MSDRPAHRGGGRGGGGGGGFRGGRGGHGGGRGGGDRGDRGGHHGGGGSGQDRERPKKENILDLAKYMDKQITVKFNGGRQGEPYPPCSLSLCHPSHPLPLSLSALSLFLSPSLDTILVSPAYLRPSLVAAFCWDRVVVTRMLHVVFGGRCEPAFGSDPSYA